MKKLFFTLCALCLCGTMWGQTQDSQYGLYYTVSGDEATIVAPTDGSAYSNSNLATYTGDEVAEGVTAVTIPEYVDGYAVVAVGEKAFQAATIEGHFVLPGYVNTVGAGAFMDCAGITDVTIEYSSTTLTDQNTAAYTNMFYNNTSLKTVTLNRNISSRTGSAYAPFSYQHTLTTITIGAHVSSIPDMMFRDDKSYHTITSVTCYAQYPPSMSTSAAPFDRCFSSVGAVPLYVPSTSVQDYKDDTTWAGVFGDNIQEIAGYVVPDEEQPDGTLRDVTTGLYFEINEGVVSIVADASGVYTDDNLVKNDDGSYTLPYYVEDKGGTSGYVTRIDESAFSSSLISGHLVIPATILYIGKSAFKTCTGLTEVTYEYSETALADENGDATANYSFEGCTGVKTVNLYRNVTLGSSSRLCAPFCYTTSITKVIVGENVTVIPSYMFRNTNTKCLAEVYCYAKSVPTTTYDPFGNITSCTLYVPAGYKDTYSSASYSSSSYSGEDATTWGEFFTNIEEMSEELEEGTYKDLTTGLYFEINEDGTASIYHDEAGIYTDENLVAHETITGAYTLPATVQAEEGGTEYVVNRVEAEAFANSSISGHLVVPANILYMGEGAFHGCTGLTEVTYEYSDEVLTEEYATNNGGNYSFGGCTNVATVNLYRDITLGHSKYIIGPFCATYAIKTLNIGPRVTALGDYLFHYAFSTSSTPVINCYAPVPFQLGYYSFDTGNNYTFYVPNGAATAYSTLEAASANHTAWNQSGTFTDMSDAFAITTNEGADGAYATFYNGTSAVEFFNAEATVYAATSVKIEDGDGNGNVYINDLGSVVPKATAVLVETSETQTMLAIATTEEATAPTTNYLYGYDTATTITTPTDCVYYMLTYGTDSSLGFYWGAENGGAFTSAAHKAYLAIPSDIANSASGISIKKDADGDTTGISSVEASDGAKVSGIYTIQGVRVSDMSQSGIYIVDGKKVLVK